MLKDFEIKRGHVIASISIITLLMIIFVLVSTNIKTQDSDEYITFIKYLIGIDNIKLFWIHSSIYPLICSLFMRIYPSIKVIQLLGVAILFLIGFMIWQFTKSKKAVILWAFSPIVWMLSGSITPAIPGALLFLAAYIFLKKYEEKQNRNILLLSGLMLGLSNAVTEVSWPYSIFFILVFFYKKGFKEMLQFSMAAIIGFAAKLIADYFIFGYAHFSLLRFIGANFIVFIGGHSENIIYNFYPINIINIIFGISPLLFLAYKNYKRYLKAEYIFVSVSLLFMLIVYTSGSPHHFFSIVPIAIILISKVLSKKQIALSVFLSIPIIIYLSLSSFEPGLNVLIQNDITQIQKESNYDAVIADRNIEVALAANTWGNKPHIIWLDEYLASKTGNNILKTYELKEEPRFNNFKIAKLSFSYIANIDKEYPENPPFIAIRNNTCPLEGYKLIKCYSFLCTYEKADLSGN